MSAGYLLDTSILSLFAPGRTGLPKAAIALLSKHEPASFVSVIALFEIEQGIAKLRRSPDAKPRSDLIERWVLANVEEFGERLLPFDLTCARYAGQLSDYAFSIGRHPGFADIAIAATARAHDLTLVTRNTKHFEKLDVAIFDPFDPR